jgi:hypothetical protein
MQQLWNDTDQGKKTEVLGQKSCPSANLFTTDSTWTDLGLCCPVTKHLCHGTTLYIANMVVVMTVLE